MLATNLLLHDYSTEIPTYVMVLSPVFEDFSQCLFDSTSFWDVALNWCV